MPEFTSPKVEEFFNHVHGPKDGRFASSRYTSGAGKGLFSVAKTSKRGPKRSLLGFKKHARQSFSTPHLEEFYNHVHDTATGRFSGRAASGRAGFREGSHGVGKVSTTGISKAGGLPQVATVRKSGVVSFKEAVTARATPYNFPRGDKRKGAVHTTARIAQMGKDVRDTRKTGSTLADRHAVKMAESAIQKAQAIRHDKAAQKRQGLIYPSFGK